MKTQHTLHFPLFPSIMTSLAKERIDLMQMIIMIAMLSVIFGLTGSYVFCKSGSMIEFFGGNKKTRKMRIIRILISVVIGGCSAMMSRTISMVMLHLIVLFLFFDVVAFVLRLFLRRKKESGVYHVLHKIYRCGALPVVIFIIVMIYGLTNMTEVKQTDYSLATVKEIGNYKIALLTDTHFDTIQSKDTVKEALTNLQNQHPDFLVLGGDIVEENTSYESMQEIFAMAGKVKTKYGVYYVYGNHDRQPYTTNKAYTEKQLDETIEKNGIHILKDSYTIINDEIILLGRDDAGWGNTSGRKSTKEILQKIPQKDREEKYIIAVDHQPIEAEENAQAGVDLELSGHTHAGQIWPIGHFTEMAGQLNYGLYQRGSCKVIVSSGEAGWGYSMRTQEHCEYVMINLQKQKVDLF